jgi:hypothetical protein
MKNIQYTMIWDMKSTSFIDNSMIIPFTTKVGYYSTNLVQAPLHQSPSAPLYDFSYQPSYLFSSEVNGFLMEEEGLIGKCRGNSHKRAAINWGKEGCEMCIVSLLLCIDVK